jgi:Ser/Thr protein kinase RdoA (MazF antagonist)
VPRPDDLRSVLRDQWHLTATRIEPRPGGLLSRAWDIEAGTERYVCRQVDAGGRTALAAALYAAQPLRDHGVEVGRPVRTLGGLLTADLDGGALAVSGRAPGRPLSGGDPVDQQFWGDRLGALHRALATFHHPGLRSFQVLDPYAPHLDAEPWLRPAVTDAISATTRLTVTDRLTYGVLHGDPAPGEFVVDPDSGRAGLLDCGVGGTGPLVYDVAAAVAYAGGPDQAAELLDGYRAAGPVPADELHAALPVLLRFRWAVAADRAARDGDAGALRRAREALEATAGSP